MKLRHVESLWCGYYDFNNLFMQEIERKLNDYADWEVLNIKYFRPTGGIENWVVIITFEKEGE